MSGTLNPTSFVIEPELSEEKTVITHVTDGFDFLGCNVRMYKKP